MVKRLFVSLLMLIGLSAVAMADVVAHKLTVHLTGDKYDYYELASKPVVEFDGDSLFIIVGNKPMTSYPRSIIANIMFDKIESQSSSEGVGTTISLSDTIIINKQASHKTDAVQQISNDKDEFVFRYVDNNTVSMQGVKGRVTVYAVNGMAISAYNADSSGVLDISLSSLPSGLYIIRTDKRSIKIQKK